MKSSVDMGCESRSGTRVLDVSPLSVVGAHLTSHWTNILSPSNPSVLPTPPTSPSLHVYREVPQRPPRVWAVRPPARLRGRPQVRPERAVRTTGRSGMAVCVCVWGGSGSGGAGPCVYRRYLQYICRFVRAGKGTVIVSESPGHLDITLPFTPPLPSHTLRSRPPTLRPARCF